MILLASSGFQEDSNSAALLALVLVLVLVLLLLLLLDAALRSGYYSQQYDRSNDLI